MCIRDVWDTCQIFQRNQFQWKYLVRHQQAPKCQPWVAATPAIQDPCCPNIFSGVQNASLAVPHWESCYRHCLWKIKKKKIKDKDKHIFNNPSKGLIAQVNECTADETMILNHHKSYWPFELVQLKKRMRSDKKNGWSATLSSEAWLNWI